MVDIEKFRDYLKREKQDLVSYDEHMEFMDSMLQGSGLEQEIFKELEIAFKDRNYDYLETVVGLAHTQPSESYGDLLIQYFPLIPDDYEVVKEDILSLMSRKMISSERMLPMLKELILRHNNSEGHYWYLYKSVEVLECIGTDEAYELIKLASVGDSRGEMVRVVNEVLERKGKNL